ncbi:MAG: DUF3887 domain-containing protein [Lachnospiraceae bacterium]|nr:DUF3887 domain-containing protein [Lachnospiraceae bacterium]
MTAERYVKEVGKLLKCRASRKKEIKRQLLSEINSTVSKGENLEDVLGRMGIPWDYANRYNDNFDKAERRAAKRERTLKIWGIVLLVIAVLIAAIYWKLPKWSDISESTVFSEEQVKAQAEEIIRLYSSNDFQAVTAYMNEDMKQVLNAATLQYTKSQMKEEFGELLAFGNMYASEAKQNGERYAMVQVSVSYANTSVTYTITFDEEMKLAGFFVK